MGAAGADERWFTRRQRNGAVSVRKGIAYGMRRSRQFRTVSRTEMAVPLL
jgi:hypothetical protein